MPPTLGAGARRVSAAALRTRYLAASMGGRAAWPTVRHLADKLPHTADLEIKAEFTAFPQGVRQRKVELAA